MGQKRDDGHPPDASQIRKWNNLSPSHGYGHKNNRRTHGGLARRPFWERPRPLKEQYGVLCFPSAFQVHPPTLLSITTRTVFRSAPSLKEGYVKTGRGRITGRVGACGQPGMSKPRSMFQGNRMCLDCPWRCPACSPPRRWAGTLGSIVRRQSGPTEPTLCVREFCTTIDWPRASVAFPRQHCVDSLDVAVPTV